MVDLLEPAEAWPEARTDMEPWDTVLGRKRSKRLVMDTLNGYGWRTGLGPRSLRDFAQGPLIGLKADPGSSGVGTVLGNVSLGRRSIRIDRNGGFSTRRLLPI